MLKHVIWFTNPYPEHRQRCAHTQYLWGNSKNMGEFMGKLVDYFGKAKDR